MNRQECLAADRIGQAAGLPPDHPWSRHVHECPRCSALLLQYRDFIAAADVPAGAQPEDAARRLSDTIAALAADDVAPVAASPRPRSASVLERLAAWWAAPALRPAMALAVIALVAAGWWSLRPRTAQEDTLRGGSAAEPMIELRAMAAGDEALVLGWSAVPGASTYAVTLLGASLDVRAELPLTADTTTSLERALWPESAPGETLYVRIDALHEAQLVAISSLHPIVLAR